jgi:hypothetical protein
LDDDIPKTAGEDNLDIGISLLEEAIVVDDEVVEFNVELVGCGVEVGAGVSVVAGFSGLIVIEVVVGVGNIEEAV